MGISMDSLPPRYQKQAARKLDPVAYEKALQFFHAEESAKNPARQAQGYSITLHLFSKRRTTRQMLLDVFHLT